MRYLPIKPAVSAVLVRVRPGPVRCTAKGCRAWAVYGWRCAPHGHWGELYCERHAPPQCSLLPRLSDEEAS